MMSDVGIFKTVITVAPLARPDKYRELREVVVDSGSEYTWLPRELLEELGVAIERVDRFETADGRILERQVGFALVRAAGRATPTIVVFAEPGDMALLGALGLEGMNLRVDLVRRQLVPAGPVPVAISRAA
jgi:predicted aspartyl protease